MSNELDRWLTFGRIASSDLAGLVFDGLKRGDWSPDEAARLMEAALLAFGNGRCARLASVVALEAGLPVAALWRRDDPAAPLVHAAAVDPRAGIALDVLGARPLQELRAELAAAVGPVRLAALEPLRPDEFEDGEYERLAVVASGMPWMPGTGRRAPTPREWMGLVLDCGDAARGL